MTRDDFLPLWADVADKIAVLFATKNKSYGASEDLFHNFRATAKRVLPGQNEQEAMFQVLACYVDKHWVALCNRGLADPEFEERCKDIIVYMALALAMKKGKGK
jgi:hypothetical protein